MPNLSSDANNSKHILVFGKDGQVGRALKDCLKEAHLPIIFLGRKDCDLTNKLDLKDVLNRYQPQIIINAAAYTSVDRAETDDNLAYAINRDAVALMAEHIANVANSTFVHFSTDYVYSGSKQGTYLESDDTQPLNLYGKSKLAGEKELIKAFQAVAHSEISSRYFILRTSWVYGDGNNFIRTMLRLASEKDCLQVVADQYGAPTSADWLASIATQLIKSQAKSGVYHAVADGRTTWHELAVFVIGLAKEFGCALKVKSDSVLPINSSEYPTAALRPKNSCLDNSKLKQLLAEISCANQIPSWKDQVREYLKSYAHKALKE